MTKGFKFDATKLELATARLKQTKLNQAKQAWMLRRTKNRVIAHQLPKKSDQVVFCALSEAQLKIFSSLSSHPDTRMVLTAWDRCTCGRKKTRVNCCYRQEDISLYFRSLLFSFN
jgi:SNF2 family DNA or RNA helicase